MPPVSAYHSNKKVFWDKLEHGASATEIMEEFHISYPTLVKWWTLATNESHKFIALPEEDSGKTVVTVSPYNQITINNGLVMKLGLPTVPGDKLTIESTTADNGDYVITLRKVS